MNPNDQAAKYIEMWEKVRNKDDSSKPVKALLPKKGLDISLVINTIKHYKGRTTDVTIDRNRFDDNVLVTSSN